MKRTILSLLICCGATAFGQPTVVLRENNVENAYPRISKDGKKILYQSNRTGSWQLFTCDIHGRNKKRITNDKSNNNLPDWSPDNTWIAFVSDRDGNEEIYTARTDGSAVSRITNDGARDIHPYISPDGKYILFNSDRNGNQLDIYRYNVAAKTTERLTNTPSHETCARYSPDMKQIVLLKNSDIADDIYLMPTNGSTMTNLSNTPNVNHGWPVFSHDGMWVYYSSMEKGSYSLYRIHPDGSGKQQLTDAKAGEEHARVNIARNGKFMVYNIRQGGTISIVSQEISN